MKTSDILKALIEFGHSIEGIKLELGFDDLDLLGFCGDNGTNEERVKLLRMLRDAIESEISMIAPIKTCSGYSVTESEGVASTVTRKDEIEHKESPYTCLACFGRGCAKCTPVKYRKE